MDDLREMIAQARRRDDEFHGADLSCGEHLGLWNKGDHPYGKPDRCPFCGEEPEYTSLFYNGSGPPPQYAFVCTCGAQGPCGEGAERGDQIGARFDALKVWNTRA